MTQYPFYGASRTLPANYEAEYYSDPSVGENPFSDTNGVLSITVSKAAAGSNPLNLPYDSGAITTYKSFAQLYGYFEINAQLPSEAGLWPSFWMMPVNGQSKTELDIFELLGINATTLHASTHSNVTGDSTTQAITVPNTATGFHTYGVDWEPTTITFYMDGKAIASAPTPPDMNVPMYLLLNVAVGTTGDWAGPANPATFVPASMQVDYVRAYATAATVGTSTATLPTASAILPTVQASPAAGKGAITVSTVHYNPAFAQAGVGVALLNAAGQVVATGVTDSNGLFTFSGLAGGSYQVRYLAPPTLALQAGGQANVTTGLTAAFTLGSGQNLSITHENVVSTAYLGGSVQILGAAQPAGISVALLNSSGTTIATTTTDSNGAFAFYTLPGTYSVQYTPPAGAVLGIGSHADPTTHISPAVALIASQAFTLTPETIVANPATIAGSVVYNTATTSLAEPGVTVTLLNTSGAVVNTTTTNTNGAFSFASLPTGTYQVQYTAAANTLFATSSAANPTTGLTPTITLAAGQTASLPTETLIPAPASITGSVMLANLTQIAQASVTVTLLSTTGTTLATATTNSSGAFSFTNLAAGSYQVKYTTPAGEVIQSGPASTSSGLTGTLILTAGQNLALPAEVLGGAPGIVTGNTLLGSKAQAGVIVELLNGAGTATLATTTTNASGFYTFTSVAANYYRVQYLTPAGEVIQSGPASTTTGQTVAFGVAIGATRTIGPVIFSGQAADLTTAAASLSGSVDYLAAGQAGVSVALISATGVALATTTTSSTGAFNFASLAAGSYQLRYTAPTGEALQYGGAANVLSGLSPTITLAAGQAVSVPTEMLVASQNDVGVYLNWPGTATYDASLSAYTATVGAAPTHVDSGVDYTQPMSDWVSGAQGAAGYLRATTDGASIVPDIAVPLISAVSNGQTELQNFNAITSGQDDSVWLGIVKAYQTQGYTTIDLRIGWEQNGDWYPWSISTQAEAQAYVAAFQHIATLVHNVAGIAVNVVWNPAEVDSSTIPTAETYAGNAYVDTVGLDLYDSIYPLSLYDWSTHTVDASLAQWEANPVNLAHYWSYPDASATNPTGSGAGYGLADAMQFAAANGKPFALPETGAGGSSTSITDDAVFPEYLASAVLASGSPKLAFANIWDSGPYVFSDGSKPDEATAWADFVKKLSQGDPGPSAVSGSTTVAHGHTVNLGSQIAALITPGKSGDTETITAVSTSLGTASLGSAGAITYTAPAHGSAILSYTVTDQLGDVATFTDTITIDPGPTSSGSLTIGHGQTVNLTSQILALVTPGLTGDTETITAITTTSGAVTLSPSGAVTYIAPATGTGTLSYTVTDQLGDSATFATAITADPGPQIQAGSANVITGTTAALGTAIASLITPGLPGTTESITAVSATRGVATLGTGGSISYTAPSTTGTDTLTYTVADQYGDTATGTYALTIAPTPGTISGNTSLYSTAIPAGSAQNGVTVSLVNTAGTVIATTVSSAGWYIFRTVSPGSYQLQFTPVAGEVIKPGSAIALATGLTAAFTVTPGQSYVAPNAGFVPAASLTGTVQLAGVAQPGVTVTVTSAASVVATATTDSNGAFAFTALQAGTYQVKYTAPSGAVLQSGPANTTTGLTAAVALAAGQTLALATETLAPAYAAMTGSVLFAGAGQSGVAVSLLNSGGAVVAKTTSGSNGAFSFAQLAAGSYALAYTAPAGEAFQAGDPANTTTGVTGLLTVVAGQTLAAAPEHLLLAPVTLVMSGKNQTLTEGNAPFIVTGAPSSSTLTLGNADQNVTLGGFSDLVTVGNGNSTVALSGSLQTLFMGDGRQTATLNGNFDIAKISNTPVGQTSTLVANGTGEAITGGNGNIIVTGPTGSSTVTLGNGNDTVTLTGSHNTVTVGTGTSVINAGTDNAVVHAAGGNVSVTVAGQSNLVDIGPGAGVINAGTSSRLDTFMLNGINQGLTIINGFNASSGDVLNLARTLAGTGVNSTLSNVGNYLTTSVSNGNTTLLVDPTGGSATPGAFVTLQNVTTSVSALLAQHDFKMG